MIQNSDVDFAVKFVYNRHTRSAYMSALRPLIGIKFTREAIREYVSSWFGLAQNTIIVRKAALTLFIRIMAEYSRCKPDILDGMVYPEGSPEKRRTMASDETVRALFGVAHTTEEKLLLSVLLETGLRLSNVCTIRFSDMLDEAFHVTVKRDKYIEVFTTPTIRTLATRLMIELDADTGDYVFKTSSGEVAYYELLYRMLRKMARKAGVNVTAHMLRHRFITRVAMDSDIAVARELAGHTNISTTQRYVHPSRARLIDVAQRTGEAYKYVNPI